MAKKPAKTAKTAGASSAAGDLDILNELVELLDRSQVTSIKLQRGTATYEVSRLGMPTGFVPGPAVGGGGGGGGHGAPLPAAAAVHAGAAPAAPPADKASALLEIKSPMVGTFYRAPESGAEPYVKAGSRVAPGQTLCIIEAMKIMNELESEVSGVLREILVEDAQPVEFGQVLFRVDPNG